MGLARYARSETVPSTLALSELESARFGLPICRLDLLDTAALEPEQLQVAFARSGAEVCFLRYPAIEISWAARLMADHELLVLPADTLVYHRLERPDDVREATWQEIGPGERDELAAAVRATFADYPNHYRANPLLDPRAVEEGYVEWACSLVQRADATAMWSGAVGDPSGFGAVQLTGSEGEVALVGVLPGARGRGAFDVLMGDLEAHLWGAGAEHLVISTQAWNLASQRTWARRGYLPHAAFTTVHLIRGSARDRLLGR